MLPYPEKALSPTVVEMINDESSGASLLPFGVQRDESLVFIATTTVRIVNRNNMALYSFNLDSERSRSKTQLISIESAVPGFDSQNHEIRMFSYLGFSPLASFLKSVPDKFVPGCPVTEMVRLFCRRLTTIAIFG